MYIKDRLRMVITKGHRERVVITKGHREWCLRLSERDFILSVGERASRDRGREEGGGRKVVSGEGYFYAFKILRM